MATKGNLFRFECLPNFRQAGGFKLKTNNGVAIKDGLLYRSSNVHYVTRKDVEMLERLRIRTIVDLRSTNDYLRYNKKGNREAASRYAVYTAQNGEVKLLEEAVVPQEPKPPVVQSEPDAEQVRRRCVDTDAEPSTQRRHLITDMWSTARGIRYAFAKLGFVSKCICLLLKALDIVCRSKLSARYLTSQSINKMDMWEHYTVMVDNSKGPIAQTLRILSEGANLPALVQCAAGKDRTGIIVALVLGCLGVDQEVIVQDYAESHHNLGKVRDGFLKKANQLGVRPDFVGAHPECMRKFLNYLEERYGGILGYLDHIGFTREDQDRLRELFLAD